jgi:hypothetical protein
MENRPEWMKDNVGWIIGAIAIVLIVGGIHYFSADYPRITSIPDDTTTGQSTPPPMSSTPPGATFTGTVSPNSLHKSAAYHMMPADPQQRRMVIIQLAR